MISNYKKNRENDKELSTVCMGKGDFYRIAKTNYQTMIAFR